MKESAFLSLIFLLVAQSATAREHVVLASEDDWYPYAATRDGQAQGLSVDIVKAAYQAVDVTLTLEPVPFKRGLILTKNGSYAGVFNSGLSDSVRTDFLIPRNFLFVSELVVVAKAGVPFHGRDSFHGKRLSLTLGYGYPADITADLANIVSMTGADLNNLKVIAAGRADFTIIEGRVLVSIFAKEPELKLVLANVGTLQKEKIYVVFSRNEAGEKARALFDRGMDTISQNGVLNILFKSWADSLH